MRLPPEHIIEAHDHKGHRLLQLLDPRFDLRFNTKLERFEVWARQWIMDRPVWAFIERVVADEKSGGFAEPGEWLVNKLKRRDPRHNPDIDRIVKDVSAEMNADEARIAAEREKRNKEEIAELVDDTVRPILRFLGEDRDIHPTPDVPFVVPDTLPEEKK